jgi:hypothetical protein
MDFVLNPFSGAGRISAFHLCSCFLLLVETLRQVVPLFKASYVISENTTPKQNKKGDKCGTSVAKAAKTSLK